MAQKTLKTQVHVERVEAKLEQEEWLPPARKLLMDTEKARFLVEEKEQGEARKWVQEILYPMMLKEVVEGKTEIKVAHNLGGGVLRHVIEHLKQLDYDATMGPMSRSDERPTLIVGWGCS